MKTCLNKVLKIKLMILKILKNYICMDAGSITLSDQFLNKLAYQWFKKRINH